MKYDSNKQRYIDVLLNKDISFKGISLKIIDIIYILLIWIVALIVRLKLFPIQSGDYVGFLRNWMDLIKEYGPINSLGKEISNYTAPYMYLMCLVSKFDNSLYALKSISVVFDYISSIAVFFIVHHMTNNTKKAIYGMTFLLLCPSIIIDSAWWCQCDIIYISFILWAIYFLIKDNSTLCMIFVGIAFAFKLQTVFILPFLLILWLKHKTVRLLDIIYIPAVYVIMQLPSVILGRTFSDMMLIYFNQADTYPWGTLEYPNVYVFLDETIHDMHYTKDITSSGTWITILIILFLAYYIYGKNFNITNEFIIVLGMFSVGIIVYTLPHMHERYGLMIDIFAIIYSILKPRRTVLMLGFILVSVISYMPFLISKYIIEPVYVAVALLGIITYVGYDLYNLIKINEKVEA